MSEQAPLSLGRAWRVVSVTTNKSLVEMFAIVLGTTMAGMGVMLMVDPNSHIISDSLAVAFQWAAPRTWGVMMLGLPALLLLTFLTKPDDAMWPAFGMALLWMALAASILFTLNSGGVPVSLWAHLGLGVASAVLTLGCAFREE